MIKDAIDAELTVRGIGECGCDLLAYPDPRPPCAVCGEELQVTRPMSHIHFKGQMFHEYCLLLALLRQVEASMVQ